MFVGELHSCYCYGSSGQPWSIPDVPDGWWPHSSCCDFDCAIPTARFRFSVLDQKVLQACLGFVLFGIRTLHTNLIDLEQDIVEKALAIVPILNLVDDEGKIQCYSSS